MRVGRGAFSKWLDGHPRVAAALVVLMFMGLGASCMVELVEREEILGRVFGARAIVEAEWLLAWSALWIIAYASLKRSPKRRDQRRAIGRIVGWTCDMWNGRIRHMARRSQLDVQPRRQPVPHR